MRIEVRLCKTLSRRQGHGFAILLKDGATVGDALTRLRLASEGYHLALCNGHSLLTDSGVVDRTRRLADGDHLVLSAATEAPHSFRLPLHSFALWLSGLLSPQAQTR